ncbi:uncharacterized protein LOC123257302 [Drosophila ananassae]|uniref:uncharacterized protein LOC123257302 n=1 Tax=Drosophila ananassae TaxID=7217 RepID=UPI000177D34D|nr:uncharacterized protein LOC123257302 [Drosophila ananassae]
MASTRTVLFCLFFYILVLGALATDSEIVEAMDIKVESAADPNETRPTETWQESGAMQVKPYNILEANCPQGYVLANKHCHRRV